MFSGDISQYLCLSQVQPSQLSPRKEVLTTEQASYEEEEGSGQREMTRAPATQDLS